MKVFVFWSRTSGSAYSYDQCEVCDSRAEALGFINALPPDTEIDKVIEGVLLMLEPVAAKTVYKFAEK